jgi:TonB-linked SusC/RagA family outer membrane protein
MKKTLRQQCCGGALTIMKILSVQTFLALLLASIVYAHDLSGQGILDTEISVAFEDTSLKKALLKIERVAGVKFTYSPSVIEANQKVSIRVSNQKLAVLLDELFGSLEISYRIVAGRILLYKASQARSFFGNQTVNTENLILRVTGTVMDENSQPLPGVNVIEKGTTNGTATDADGKFSLSVQDENSVLVFSFIGYTSQEISVNERSVIDVALVEDVHRLEEVVVVGYGTQKEVNLTGAVSTVTSEKLANRPIASVGLGLQGLIPNLNISIRNGDPTTAASFNIRGFTSINGGSPLILVDGVPMELEWINPSDIESVTVLKDAAAAAVYGARAAFGVILVQTKKGKGKLNVTLSTEQSLAKPIYLMDVITDPHEFVVNWNNAFSRTHGRNYYDQDYVEGTKRWVENPTEENAWGVFNGELRFYGYNDYSNKLITDFAPQQKYDMSISGDSENSSYYVSFGFLNKEGYLNNREKNENFKRYNILMKAEFKINDWLSLDEKMVLNLEMSDKPHFYNWDVNINSAARVAPIFGLKFPDLPYYIEPGDHDQYEKYIGLYLNHTTFLPYLEKGGRNTFTNNDIWLTQGITLTPIEGLKIRSDFSFNTYTRNSQDVSSNVEVFGNWRNANLYNPTIEYNYSSNDWVDNRNDYNQYYVFNTYAEYMPNILDDHYLKIMVGFNQEWGRNTYVRARANDLITQQIIDLNATSGTQQTWGGKSHASLRGMFYRLNYIYKDKYLFETNGRYDGTSRFPKDSRFGFFPSASIGWKISSEPFMAGTQRWLNNLKLRASYGELGNQLLGSNYYPYITTMESGMSNFLMSSSGRIPYVSAGGLVSPSLTWETVATLNFGVDFTLLDRRLAISGDIYTRDTREMLMRTDYPDVLGTTAPQQNSADLRTKGWEMSVIWGDEIGQGWQYKLNLALSDNQSKITKYDNPTGALSEYYVGKKIGEIWGYVTEGIFQTEEELNAHADQSQMGANWKVGDIKYADLNGDEKITAGSNTLDDPGDRKIIGNSTARYSFGISPEISYKNWTLNFFFQGLFRDYLPSYGAHNAFYPFNSFFLVENYYLKETWSENNRDAYFAAMHVSANGHHKNIMPQSRYVQNAAYVRLKNLTLNYNFPQDLVNKVGMSRAQVYFSGMNLWEYTRIHKPLDPESVFTTTQEYYLQRIYALGVRATF